MSTIDGSLFSRRGGCGCKPLSSGLWQLRCKCWWYQAGRGLEAAGLGGCPAGFADLRLFYCSGHPVAQVCRAHAFAVAAQKQGLLGVVQQKAGAGFIEVFLQSVKCVFGHRDEAAFADLALADVCGGVLQVEVDQFAAAGCRGVEGFQYGTVADVGDVEHGGEFPAAEAFGQLVVRRDWRGCGLAVSSEQRAA